MKIRNRATSKIEMGNQQISDILAALVTLESPSGKEQGATSHIEKILKELSIPVEVQKVQNRSNLISSKLPNRKPLLLLCSHLDTVPASGSLLHKMKIEKRRLIGLGACDAKASIVAMISAYRELMVRGVSDHVSLAFFVGEEESGDGGMTYIRNGYRPQYAIVGEPTNITLPWAQAGYTHLTFDARCKPKHAFSIHGLDAVSLIIAAVREVEKIVNDLSKGLPLIEKPNLFVQYINGGSHDKFWYLRHNCYISFLINIHPKWDPSKFISLIKDKIKILQGKKSDAKIRIKIESWDPGFKFDSKILRKAIIEAMKNNGLAYQPSYMRSWTDAATLIWKGVHTAVIGPGSLQHAHSSNENVLFSDIRIAANVYYNAALELFKLTNEGGEH